jgi:hypothetical protein
MDRTRAMGLKVKAIPGPAGRKWTDYLVTDANGRDVGVLVKWRDTRTDKHPWKAYGALDHYEVGSSVVGREFLGAFYPEDGGRASALAMIARASRKI